MEELKKAPTHGRSDYSDLPGSLLREVLQLPGEKPVTELTASGEDVEYAVLKAAGPKTGEEGQMDHDLRYQHFFCSNKMFILNFN